MGVKLKLGDGRPNPRGLRFMAAFYLLLAALSFVVIVLNAALGEWGRVAAGVPLVAVFLAVRAWMQALARRDARLEAGQCVACGYSLTGNVSGRCPECGKAPK